ncbi:MAG: cytochrome c-type biogenesis protein CcmH [Proteobacteria bacterium]|nr:cytochrome c-type biogenesis protein CcmH [Pseudomonadota bacterium]
MQSLQKQFIICLSVLIACNAVAKSSSLEYDTQIRSISSKLRCLVCNGSPVSESNTVFASGIKAIIKEKLEAGFSEDKIINYIVSIYGPEILFEPEIKKSTYILWFLPLILLALCMFFLLKKYIVNNL